MHLKTKYIEIHKPNFNIHLMKMDINRIIINHNDDMRDSIPKTQNQQPKHHFLFLTNKGLLTLFSLIW